MAVILMICFARSGGTVLNQCLGSLPNVVMLSEINPLGGGWGVLGKNSFTTVKEQAKNWYQVDLVSDGFVESILELQRYCDENNRCLVIRDWSFVNFVSCDNNDFNPPGRLLTLESLQGRSNLIHFAFVRDSIDVWISRGAPEVNDFFYPYLQYVKALIDNNTAIYKYEDFCSEPSIVIRNICEYAGLKYSDSYKNYASFTKVNGDVQISGGSRGAKQRIIKLLPRRQLSEEKIIEVNQCAEMVAANKLLKYPVSYYDVMIKKTLKDE